ncbi:MAG: SMI1/KNR4 family protein [Bacteroidota bacterium]|nr:SMI1/KNR4 family protein [Bacteroidota bacterium]
MIASIVELIKQKIGDPKVPCTFNPGASKDEIRKLEEEMNVALPDSFRYFLSHFNGGYISLFPKEKKIDPETDAWNSNYILSLLEIRQAYNRIQYKFSENGPRFIPVLHTRDQEYLAFRVPTDEKEKESKLYDIWHEAFPSEWESQIVYDNFTEMMADYVENNGDINTMG